MLPRLVFQAFFNQAFFNVEAIFNVRLFFSKMHSKRLLKKTKAHKEITANCC